jgi:4-diphosphocytidyl-2-C-methyl-D-erythritol kinase
MRKDERPEEMRLLSPAKINLFLFVTGKRTDGYHTLSTLMCPIGIHDEITLEFGRRATTCRCNHPEVPSGPDNLAHRAAVHFLERIAAGGERGGEGVAISIEKHIPVGAGLGGGSSNAATVLLGLNRHFGMPLTRDALISLGASLGADVPFFIFGAPALAKGIGEILEPSPPLPPFQVVLIYPGKPVSTAAVYKNLKLGLTNHEKENRKILFDGKVFDPAAHLHNDLEAVAASFCPVIRSAREALSIAGADGVLTSGSGSSVFGIFYNAEQAAAAKETLHRRHADWQVFLADAIV